MALSGYAAKSHFTYIGAFLVQLHCVSTFTSPRTSTWQARRILGFFLRSPRSQNFSINVRGLVFDEGETATRSVPHKPLPRQLAYFHMPQYTGTSFSNAG